MTRKIHSHLTLFLILVGAFLAFACIPQTPIPVYVTPTPQEATAEVVAPVTAAPSIVVPTDTATATESPTVTATPPPAETLSPELITPSPTFIGAITGPEYTLPPTETPKPPTEVPPPSPTGPTTTPLPKLNPRYIGIQIDGNVSKSDWESSMYRAEQLGVDWIKLQVNWSYLQPNSPDDYPQEFQDFEWYIRNAEDRGFDILLSIAKAPPWSKTNISNDGPPDNPQLLANFISLLLTRFGNVIDAVEIWNEPNLVREWTGALAFNGAGYMQLFAPSYNAIRAYSSTLTIVTAGLAPTGDNPGASINDRTYLQQMYNAGLGNYQDVVIGVHPYSWGNAPDAHCCDPVPDRGWDDHPQFFFGNTIDDYREIMAKNGHPEHQMWITEFGWASWENLEGSPPNGDDWILYNSEADQANYAIRALEIGQSRDDIGVMFLWNLNYANAFSLALRNEIAAYSIVIPSRFPPERPLYFLLREVTKK